MEISAAQVQQLREKTGLGMMTCKKALIETGGDMEKAVDNLRKQGEATAAKRAGKAAKEGKISIVSDATTTIMYEVNSETDFVARNEDFISFVEELGVQLLAKKPASIDEAKSLTSPKFGGATFDAKLKELIAKIGENLTFNRYFIGTANPSSERYLSYIHGPGKIGVLVKVCADKAEALDSEQFSQLGKDLAMQVAASKPVAPSRDSIPADILSKEKEIYLAQAEATGKPQAVLEKIVQGKLEKYFKEIILTEQVYIKNPDVIVSVRIAEVEKELGTKISIPQFVRFERGVDEA